MIFSILNYEKSYVRKTTLIKKYNFHILLLRLVTILILSFFVMHFMQSKNLMKLLVAEIYILQKSLFLETAMKNPPPPLAFKLKY